MPNLTWSEVKSRTNALLNQSAEIAGADAGIAQQMRLCALDLQARIQSFRIEHHTPIARETLIEDGYAHLGNLPAGADPKQWYIVDSDDATTPHPRGMLRQWPWEYRHDLINKTMSDKEQGYIALAPDRRHFYVYPKIEESDRLVVTWDGQKINFDDDEVTPFPEETVEAFYAWVKAYILRDIENNPAAAREFRSGYRGGPGLYEQIVTSLHIEYGNGLTIRTTG